MFQEIQPTVISLIPRHIEILEKTKGWSELDMKCVRYMVTGSQPLVQPIIDSLNRKGVSVVANWYGMTEMPPPVLIGYNSTSFMPTPCRDYKVDFTEEGECIINGMYTGDIFNLEDRTFLHRKVQSNGTTWKNNF
jgi:acyl-coenzyme A synthetase/AMP-(fatty) acid ligase